MLRETAYAKINLALHVRRRRDDGYHDIETLFAFCDGGDEVTAAPAARTSLAVDGPFAHQLGTGPDNLVLRAAALFPDVPVALRLTKRLPVASGIGGGSADAAATLRLLARLSGRPLPGRAAQRALGADVPACVAATTARGSGVGDVMTAAASMPGRPVLLVNPGVAVATAAVFARWDGVDRGALGDWRDGRNDLQPAACAMHPEIAALLDRLARLAGIAQLRMSGSGATCFALFDDCAARDRAARAVSRERPDWWVMATCLR